jgi:tetratricopeptide (TPR) repeat protein
VVNVPLQAWNNLGALRAVQGDAAAAEAAFRQAITANPRYIPAWTNMAILLTNQGRYDEAITAWRTIVSLAPENSLAKKTMQQLAAARGESR